MGLGTWSRLIASIWLIRPQTGLIGVYGLLNVLYQFGGMYVVLFPALFWAKAVLETTGVLALVIASYSYLHQSNISAHWYSLPTGCTPLSMAAQYFPSSYIALALFSAFLGYCGFLKSKGITKQQWTHISGQLDKSKLAVVLPSVAIAASIAVRDFVLHQDQYHNFVLGAAALLYIRSVLQSSVGSKVKKLL